ncbi:MAG: hypothetical protein ACYTE0_13125 [Planctomycetota bacterium]|jgi:hypothetical protein
MILYHGTSGANVEKILKEGIRPRGKRQGNWDCESRSDSVYLTDLYAPYYGISSVDEDDSLGEIAVFEVDVDEVRLMPDEDFLEQGSRKTDICPVEDIGARTYWFRDRLPNFAHHWKDSLAKLGTVAHLGEIVPERIIRVSTFLADKHPMVVCELGNPTITLMNHKMCGDRYKMLTAVCMKDDCRLGDFFLFSEVLSNIADPEEKGRMVEMLGQTEKDKQRLKTAIEAFRADVVVRDLRKERES